MFNILGLGLRSDLGAFLKDRRASQFALAILFKWSTTESLIPLTEHFSSVVSARSFDPPMATKATTIASENANQLMDFDSKVVTSENPAFFIDSVAWKAEVEKTLNLWTSFNLFIPSRHNGIKRNAAHFLQDLV